MQQVRKVCRVRPGRLDHRARRGRQAQPVHRVLKVRRVCPASTGVVRGSALTRTQLATQYRMEALAIGLRLLWLPEDRALT